MLPALPPYIIALSPPYSEPLQSYLAVPAPDVVEATTPELETKFFSFVTLPLFPYANIAKSAP